MILPFTLVLLYFVEIALQKRNLIICPNIYENMYKRIKFLSNWFNFSFIVINKNGNNVSSTVKSISTNIALYYKTPDFIYFAQYLESK